MVGGAIGTGLAIATAPVTTEAYAWDNGYRGGWSESYAKRNGSVCRPGTWFRGEDGRQHICQWPSREQVLRTRARKGRLCHGNDPHLPLPNQHNRLVAVRRQL